MPWTRLSVARLLALLILLVTPWLVAAGGRPVLPPDAASGFRQLIQLVNDGQKLGTNARITGVAIQEDKVKLSFALGAAKEPVEVVLQHPSALRLGEQTRWFSTTRPSGFESVEQWRALLLLLDEAFVRSPWTTARSTAHPATTPPDPLSWIAPTTVRRIALPLAALAIAVAIAAAVVVFRQQKPAVKHGCDDAR